MLASTPRHLTFGGRAAERALELPRDAPCVEVDDVRTAISACVNPPADRIVCPRSLEHACARYAAEVPPCAPTTAEIEPYRVGWADIAFGIATYNAQHELLLLAAAGATWLPAAAGADLLLVTDADDPRSDDEIAPRVTGDSVAVHVHRCPRCRGKWTTGVENTAALTSCTPLYTKIDATTSERYLPALASLTPSRATRVGGALASSVVNPRRPSLTRPQAYSVPLAVKASE